MPQRAGTKYGGFQAADRSPDAGGLMADGTAARNPCATPSSGPATKPNALRTAARRGNSI